MTDQPGAKSTGKIEKAKFLWLTDTDTWCAVFPLASEGSASEVNLQLQVISNDHRN
jgi:hypothetical protein